MGIKPIAELVNYRSILKCFINRSTNPSAESYNAKIKVSRSQIRKVKNVEFYLYRKNNFRINTKIEIDPLKKA